MDLSLILAAMKGISVLVSSDAGTAQTAVTVRELLETE